MVFGNPRSYHKRFKFVLEIDGFTATAADGAVGFQKCSELSAETAKVEYYEGGAEIPDKSPGRTSFTDVTLERGASSNLDLFNWYKQVIDAAANKGLVDAEYKRGVDIVQLDRDGDELRRWRLTNAWPVKYVAGDWDNETDENLIETLTLTFDYFDLST